MAQRLLDPSLDRRSFLKVGAAIGGGLCLTIAPAGTLEAAGPAEHQRFAPNAFIRIDRGSTVTLVMPMVEMGQGIYTALAMLLAEELEVDLARVKLEHAPPNDALYANAILHAQSTGLSSSIRAFWTPLRQAGAVARTLLVVAAAKRWGIAPSRCRAKQGVVHDASGARQLSFGELVDVAATLPIPAPGTIRLKQPRAFTLIGKPVKRLDSPDKVSGRAQFGIDVNVPGMKIAAISLCPVFGGKVKSLDEQAARAVNGVHQVVRIDNAVAVVADHMWAAKKGLEAADVKWDEGPNSRVSSADVWRQLEEAATQPGAVARSEGNAQQALAAASQRIEATYRLPFLAHATMEPMNCTVHVRKDGCDLWVGTQAPTLTQTMVAQTLGLSKESVNVHNHLLGGGFGRRLEADGSVLAAQIAARVDAPVKVIWSREEDIQHDMYRPCYYDSISAGLDANGRPVAWTHRVAGSSVVARYVPPLFKNGIDFDAVEGAAEPPYALPNIHVDYVRVEPPGIPTAFWRGVGPVKNIFVVETFIDELAAAARQDPVAYRRILLAHDARMLGVLNLAVEKADWGQPLQGRRARGVAVQHAFGSYLAQVADVELRDDGTIKVHRLVCAVDCGLVVNPDTIAAQVEGGSLFGLTAALYGSITLENGRVQQSNFHDYRPMRMNESPVIETHIVQSSEAPGGFGEAPTSIVAPAVVNAICTVTGKRIRSLPIEPALLKG